MYDDPLTKEIPNFPDPFLHREEFEYHCSFICNWLSHHPETPSLIFKTESGMLNGVPMCQIEDHFRKFLVKRAAENPKLPIFIWRRGPEIVLEKVI